MGFVLKRHCGLKSITFRFTFFSTVEEDPFIRFRYEITNNNFLLVAYLKR